MERYTISKEEEKDRVNRNQKRNHRILLSITLATVIAAGGCVIKGMPHFINESMDDVLEDNKEMTLFDDVLALDETVGVTNISTGEVEQIQVEDAIRMLEEKANTLETLKSISITEKDLIELTDESKQATIDFYNENGIDAIIELYNDDENNTIEKARIAQQLLYIEEYDKAWLKENGIPLSNSILTRVISAGAIDAYGTFEPIDYKVCEFDTVNRGAIKEVLLNDPVSGATDKIVLLPVLAEEYNEAYAKLQLISTKKEFTEDETLLMVNETLNVTKRCINKELVKGNVFTYTKNTSKEESV